MNIQGYEIDLSFVYYVSPVFNCNTREDSFYYFFNLQFKDGRSHKVELSYNYESMKYEGKAYSINIKSLNSRELKLVPKKRDAAKIQITKLRNDIILEKSKL
jgi:hypothetical protein